MSPPLRLPWGRYSRLPSPEKRYQLPGKRALPPLEAGVFEAGTGVGASGDDVGAAGNDDRAAGVAGRDGMGLVPPAARTPTERTRPSAAGR